MMAPRKSATRKPRKPKSEKALKNDIRARIRQLFVWYGEGYKNTKKKAQISYDLFQCEICASITKKIKVDHVSPVIGVNEKTSEISLDEYFNRVFCDETNLQAICESCHDDKTQMENLERHGKKTPEILEKIQTNIC